MHCTQCGTEGSGRFCASCGASLQSIVCTGCGVAVSPGTRFCTRCGASVRAPSSGLRHGGDAQRAPGLQGDKLGWVVAGAVFTLLLGVVGYQVVLKDDGEQVSAGAPALGPTTSVDLSSLTPREAADRLFKRVMDALTQGNNAEAVAFLPMAIDAYGLARPLDSDGLYHLALLQGAAGDFAGSLETAREGIEGAPEHLLLLSSAAEASRELGDTAAAAEYYTLLLDAWDRELALLRPEYTDHSRILPLVREDAELFLAEAAP